MRRNESKAHHQFGVKYLHTPRTVDSDKPSSWSWHGHWCSGQERRIVAIYSANLTMAAYTFIRGDIFNVLLWLLSSQLSFWKTPWNGNTFVRVKHTVVDMAMILRYFHRTYTVSDTRHSCVYYDNTFRYTNFELEAIHCLRGQTALWMEHQSVLDSSQLAATRKKPKPNQIKKRRPAQTSHGKQRWQVLTIYMY